MSWLDDARKRAEESTKDLKKEAEAKVVGAAVQAAGAAVTKSVGGFFEGVVTAAEQSLERAEAEAQGRAQIELPEPDALAAAVRDIQQQALEEPVQEAVLDAAEPVVEEEEFVAPSSDPFAEALAAIARSRAARGVEAVEVPHPIQSPTQDPVESALAAAAKARQLAGSGGRLGAAREQAAREQLAAMKAARGLSASEGPSEPDDTSVKPKKRTL